MKPAPFALFVLALVVVVAWPLTSAIGAGTARQTASADSDVRPVGCLPDAPGEEGSPAGDLQLPPGHPPIPLDLLPPGHPPISSGSPALPPGHPPVRSGRPPIPAAPAPLFDAPVLLSI